MANTDYSIRGSGMICPVATSFSTLDPGQLVIPFAGYRSASGTIPAVGSAVMLDNEIMQLDAFDAVAGMITVKRGCADTVPAAHAASGTIWFFDSYVGTDSREYMASETIGVKLLMRTNGQEMELKNSPPNALAFNSRFARPYPPGRFRINDQAFFLGPLIFGAIATMDMSWAHRDRITQDDQLIGHEATSIGPEAGTTYILRFYRADNTLVKTFNVDGTTFQYTLGQAAADYAATTAATVNGYFTLQSVRGGLESFQHYRVDFSIALAGVTGWGMNWGASWNN